MAERVWSGVVLHHTASGPYATAEEIEAGHKKLGYRCIGYHYFFQRDPETEDLHLKAGRPVWWQGCHGVRHYNKHCLGVAVFGDYQVQRVCRRDYEAILAGLLHIFEKHRVGPKKLMGHRDIKATLCPGEYMPLAALAADLEKFLGV